MKITYIVNRAGGVRVSGEDRPLFDVFQSEETEEITRLVAAGFLIPQDVAEPEAPKRKR